MVQVDAIAAETPCAGSSAGPDRQWQADRPSLRCEEHSLAAIPDRLAHDSLGPPLAVDLRGVDQVDAEFERTMDYRLRVLARIAAAVAPLHRAELPRSEADRRDARAARFYELHRSLPVRPPLPLGEGSGVRVAPAGRKRSATTHHFRGHRTS